MNNYRKQLDIEMDSADKMLSKMEKAKSLVSSNSKMHNVDKQHVVDSLMKGLMCMGECKMINSAFLDELRHIFEKVDGMDFWQMLKDKYCID